MKKPSAPFKMIPVELRDHLHELTGNELKVWLCLYLHSDKTKEAFPSNSLIVQETGLTKRTVKTVKANLRKKAWIISQQRYRDNGSLSTMSETIALPRCKDFTCAGEEITPTPVQELHLPSPQTLHLPEVDTVEVDTEKPDTSKPQERSEVVSEGTVSLRSTTRCSSQSESLDDSSSLPEQQQDQNQPRHLHWHCPVLSDIWYKRTGRPFTLEEKFLATDLIATHGHHVVEAVLDITLNKRPKSAKMVWKRFQVFVDNWQTNYDLCMAWYASTPKKDYPREIPPKFDCTLTKTKAEADSYKAYFREQCKTGEWQMPSEEWALIGATEEAFTGALRFCCENLRRVTKDEFMDLIVEAMGVIHIEPAKAAAAGAGGLSEEEAE